MIKYFPRILGQPLVVLESVDIILSSVVSTLPHNVFSMTDGQDKNKRRILLVEDSPANADLFAAMLGRLGYACRHCPTGTAAIESLRECAPI
jgi:hypothetical protein